MNELKIEIRERFLLALDEVLQTGITSKALMESIGDHQQNFAQFKNGRRYPTITNIHLLARHYGYHPSWVILGEGPRMINPPKTVEERVHEVEQEVQSLKKSITSLKK